MHKNGYMTPPMPKSYNILIGTRGDTTKDKNKKDEIKKLNKKQILQTNSQIENTTSTYQLKKHTYITKQHVPPTINIHKPKNTPVRKHNYTQKNIQDDHSSLGSTILNFTSKLITHTITRVNIHK